MRKLFTTILLAIVAALSVTAAVFLAIDGNLARLTGWYRFRPGMPLFSAENMSRLNDVSWMRIKGLHDTDMIECERDENGIWWIISPFRDRMDPAAVQAILSFTANARVVGTLPLNNTTRRSLREFGVETAPHKITLKVSDADKTGYSTIARYTLGSSSPWLADAGDGRSVVPTTYLRTDYYGRDKRIHVVSGNILHIFREGLEALRDPHPLLFRPDALQEIAISHKGMQPVRLKRISAESDWNITAPAIIAADQDKVNNLVARLASLSALRVDESENVSLPPEAESVIELFAQDQDKPLRLNIYPPFASETDGQLLCYATVEGRPAVFTLQAEPRVNRRGSYSRIAAALFSLPVLPEKAMAQLKSGNGAVYVHELPLTADKLRSLRFSDINAKDVERVSLRSRYYPRPLRLLLIPGETESDISDIWMCSAGGKRYQEAETDVVRRFLNGLRDIPVAGIMEDVEPGGDVAGAMAKYGLNSPDYVISLGLRPCAYRATLFGVDLPLVKDRAPRVFFVSRYRDPKTDEGQWVGMELGGHTVCKLSPKLTRLFSLEGNAWKARNIIKFPISALRRLTLGFQQAPLELDYDYIGETWTGRLNGEDVTPRINPHRAGYYVRQLQKLKASQWVDSSDEDALSRLKTPAFTVRLDLELPDYEDVEAVVMEHDSSVFNNLDPINGSRQEKAAQLLTESTETDQALRDLAMQELKTHAKTITLEIAPSGENSDTPFFYGRIRETGEIFILNYQDAQSLAGSILDM